MLPGTPLHARTAGLCEAQNWRRWAGYVVASSYELTHEREYTAIRNGVAILDLSPLYKYRIAGPDAGKLLNRVVTRDVNKIKPGRVAYTPWCDEDGHVVDDGTLARLDEQSYRLTSADPSLRWLSINADRLEVAIEDESAKLANVALQGPLARATLNRAAEGDFDYLKFYQITRTRIAGIDVDVSRTGYTGDLGYEIWTPASSALQVWDALMAAGWDFQITPAGMLALDIARVEAGLLLIEVDYVSAHRALIDERKSSPFELSLGWTVDFEKGNFIGRKALLEEKKYGSEWKFVGIEIDWVSLETLYAAEGLPPQLPPTAWRSSVPLYVGGNQVGYASSGAWSPMLKKYIAMAHVLIAYAEPGTPLNIEVTVEHKRKQARAKVVPIPFFNPERKRA